MRHSASFRLFIVLVLVISSVQTAWASKRESRVPLQGCRGHYAASGSARYVAIRSEKKKTDGEELVIDIKNVPLTPGTTLFVFVADVPVGTIKLDSKQSGTLTMTSSSGKYVPPLEPGTSVVVKTAKGQYVMW